MENFLSGAGKSQSQLIHSELDSRDLSITPFSCCMPSCMASFLPSFCDNLFLVATNKVTLLKLLFGI